MKEGKPLHSLKVLPSQQLSLGKMLVCSFAGREKQPKLSGPVSCLQLGSSPFNGTLSSGREEVCLVPPPPNSDRRQPCLCGWHCVPCFTQCFVHPLLCCSIFAGAGTPLSETLLLCEGRNGKALGLLGYLQLAGVSGYI